MSFWRKAKREAGPAIVVELTDDGLETFLTSNRAAVVEVYLASCPHCMRMAPIYERTAKASATTLAFARLEGRLQPATPKRFNVTSAPTFLFFLNGQKVAAAAGEMTQMQLEGLIADNLGRVLA
jgi:thioredoxin-like negative regulator of GroEL